METLLPFQEMRGIVAQDGRDAFGLVLGELREHIKVRELEVFFVYDRHEHIFGRFQMEKGA